jgi:ATPase family associated with various cellular activities (AAA)
VDIGVSLAATVQARMRSSQFPEKNTPHQTMKNDQRELTLLIRSHFPILIVESPEEVRFVKLAETVCNLESHALFVWSLVNGIRRNNRSDTVVQTHNLVEALHHINKTRQNGVYVLLDAQAFVADPLNQRLIREIALDYYNVNRTLVFVGSNVKLPPDLQRMSATFRLSLPDTNELREVVREEAAYWSQQNDGQKPTGELDVLRMLCQHLVGFTRDDARRVVRQCMEVDGAITLDDIARVLRHKHESLASGGVLTLSTDFAKFADVGGQRKLKKWLERRRGAFAGDTNAAMLDTPKGVLLLGVQGGGKSLAAKAIAGSWSAPLLRLDVGALYNKFHGETERNLREALETAEAMAPCVLWLDEIEKGLSTGSDSTDGGVSRRVLGALLTWMSDRKSRVFMVATANDISCLPPELMRKGRFDEIFFVDLPTEEIRQEIFRIHLTKRAQPEAEFDVPALAKLAEGFSGAEIEQVIIAGLYEAHANGAPLTTEIVANEIRSTRPLSVVRSEEVNDLREWAAERTVMAD